MMIQKFQCLPLQVFKMNVLEVHGLLKSGVLDPVLMLMCWFIKKL